MEFKNDKDILAIIPFFAELQETDIAWFLSKSRFIDYPKNALLFQHGDSADELYIILEGWIKLFYDNVNGEQIVQSLLTRGDTFGEECVIKGKSRNNSAQVSGRNARCLVIPADVIRKRIKEHPDTAIRMISALADHLNKSGFLLQLSNQLTSAQRVAAFLLKLSLDRGGVLSVKLPYNKSLVAERLSMKPETFSRAMRRLEEDLGLKFKGREVIIPKLDALQDYCEAYCCGDSECSVREQLLCTKSECDIYKIIHFL